MNSRNPLKSMLAYLRRYAEILVSTPSFWIVLGALAIALWFAT